MSRVQGGRRGLARRDAAFVREASVGPSMTPMVDVVLVILIFFMASTAFVGPEWLLRSALPTEGARGESAAFRLPPARFDLEMSVGADGQTRVSGMGLSGATMAEAEERLGAYAGRLGASHLSVFIAPGVATPYRDVVRLHEVCAELGIEGVGLRE